MHEAPLWAPLGGLGGSPGSGKRGTEATDGWQESSSRHSCLPEDRKLERPPSWSEKWFQRGPFPLQNLLDGVPAPCFRPCAKAKVSTGPGGPSLPSKPATWWQCATGTSGQVTAGHKVRGALVRCTLQGRNGERELGRLSACSCTAPAVASLSGPSTLGGAPAGPSAVPSVGPLMVSWSSQAPLGAPAPGILGTPGVGPHVLRRGRQMTRLLSLSRTT